MVEIKTRYFLRHLKTVVVMFDMMCRGRLVELVTIISVVGLEPVELVVLLVLFVLVVLVVLVVSIATAMFLPVQPERVQIV